MEKTKIRVGDTYIFKKSGNKVKALEPTNYGGKGNWVVERTEGTSKGKQMIVGGSALIPEDSQEIDFS